MNQQPKNHGDWSRRHFLGVAGATAASVSFTSRLTGRGQDISTTQQRPSRNMKKSLKYGMVQIDGSVEDKFRLLKEIGYDGVELDSPSGLDEDEVLRARDATGLAIPGVVDSVHWQKTLSDPDPNVRGEGRRGLETALRQCQRYGGSTVLLVPAVVNKNVSYDQAYERSQNEIRQVLPLCDETGVKIAIENVWNNFLLSPMEAARYVDDFQSPNIGWYFDVGNIVNYGYPEQWIRILGPRVFKLDIKEFSRQKRNDEGLWKGFQVKLLEGDCDWPAVMQALDEIGYDGWGSAEVGGGDEARLRDIADRMDRIYAS